MGRQVYLSERGDGKKRWANPWHASVHGGAVKVSLKVKGTAFHITGSNAYVRSMNAELEANKAKWRRFPPPWIVEQIPGGYRNMPISQRVAPSAG